MNVFSKAALLAVTVALTPSCSAPASTVSCKSNEQPCDDTCAPLTSTSGKPVTCCHTGNGAVCIEGVCTCAGGGTLQLAPYSAATNPLPTCSDAGARFPCPPGSKTVTLSAAESGYSGTFTAEGSNPKCVSVKPVPATPNQFSITGALDCTWGAPTPPPCQSVVTVTDAHGGSATAYFSSSCGG